MAHHERAAGGGDSRPQGSGFTLVELLVVVAVIVLLAAIVAPTIDVSRRMATKATCATRLRGLGAASAGYTVEYGSYPPVGTGPDAGFPKIHGLMTVMDLPATSTYANGMQNFQYTLSELADVVMCPGLDATELWLWLEAAVARGRAVEAKAMRWPAGLAYQWNACLRAAGHGTGLFPSGQWPTAMWPADYSQDNTLWIDWQIRPVNGQPHMAQAAHRSQIQNLAQVAEAWDGFDLDSHPNMVYSDWNAENFVPGRHVGPANQSNGWAVLNAARHEGSPNILYADGSVRADATRPLKPSDFSGWYYAKSTEAAPARISARLSPACLPEVVSRLSAAAASRRRPGPAGSARRVRGPVSPRSPYPGRSCPPESRDRQCPRYCRR